MLKKNKLFNDKGVPISDVYLVSLNDIFYLNV